MSLFYLFLPSAICLFPFLSHSPFIVPFLSSSLVTLCLALCLHTHIKWRAAVRFQFRTHLWCCRPPTCSAVAEGTQGSPITALYANVLAPGQQRGHAGTAGLFMQISGRQSQHRAGHRHRWSYLPVSTTPSWENVVSMKDVKQVWEYGWWSDRVKQTGIRPVSKIDISVCNVWMHLFSLCRTFGIARLNV